MPTTKPAAPKAPRKPRAPRATAKKTVAHEPEAAEEVKAVVHEAKAEPAVTAEKPHVNKGKYIFATGRRKTAVANVRLFSGEGETLVNRKPLKQYFQYSFYQEEIDQPFRLTGLGKDFYFVATINGGGANSQAQALRHGISIALGKTSEEVRKVLKKNGLLTRDDRKKERKKPGLKRARRSPQWAKR